jgi:hypothetical protein
VKKSRGKITYPAECCSCNSRSVKKSEQSLKQKTIEAYGGKCFCCKEENVIFLTIDHIDGSGAEDRKISGGRGGATSYRKLKKQGYPKDNYQVLCFNCNFAKHVLGECPHKKAKRGK